MRRRLARQVHAMAGVGQALCWAGLYASPRQLQDAAAHTATARKWASERLLFQKLRCSKRCAVLLLPDTHKSGINW